MDCETGEINRFSYAYRAARRGRVAFLRVFFLVLYVIFPLLFFLFVYVTRWIPVFAVCPVLEWMLVYFTRPLYLFDIGVSFAHGELSFARIPVDGGKKKQRKILTLSVRRARVLFSPEEKNIRKIRDTGCRFLDLSGGKAGVGTALVYEETGGCAVLFDLADPKAGRLLSAFAEK